MGRTPAPREATCLWAMGPPLQVCLRGHRTPKGRVCCCLHSRRFGRLDDALVVGRAWASKGLGAGPQLSYLHGNAGGKRRWSLWQGYAWRALW